MLVELFSFLTPPLLFLEEQFLAFSERPFSLLALGDVAQDHKVTSDRNMTIPLVQGCDTQVKAALGLSCIHDDLFMDLCHLIVAFAELWPGGENLGSWLPDELCHRMAKDTLCRGIEVYNTVLLVQHNHDITHVLDQCFACYWQDV